LFDPEAALVAKAPPRPRGSPQEDGSLTIPLRGDVPPPAPTERNTDWAKTDPNFGKKPSHGAHEARHPADEDGISVVFGTEATRPGMPSTDRNASVGVVVREPESDPNLRVTEDGETLPLPGAPSTQAAPSVGSSVSRASRRLRTAPPTPVGVGRTIANKYRIESIIGAGAVGAVYRASHGDLGRTVAIKVLHPHCRADPHLLAGFRKEARAASLLDHPNVTIVHDFGEEPDGLVYIVMEHLPGMTLQAALDQERQLAPKRALAIMLQVTGALSAAHERGIVHRDVKPDNVILVQSRDDEGYPFELAKVCDFGIAALEAGPSARDGEFTAGTPEYMAPEQAQGRADARTDVYACGVMLYEMLSGGPPFTGTTVGAILKKHAQEPPPRLSALVTVDARLEALILRALEKPPERRFQAMREMRQAMKRLHT
jgi:serine/threonine-protein kinase